MTMIRPDRATLSHANTALLTVFKLPTYAPDLDPTEGVWSLVKGDVGNLAAASATSPAL